MKDDSGHIVIVAMMAVIVIALMGTFYLLALIENNTPPSSPNLAYPSHRNLTITFIDVGQGDAAYVQAPSGIEMVVDTGLDKYCDHVLDVVHGVDELIITHPHADHTGCVEEIQGKYHTAANPIHLSTNTQLFAGNSIRLDPMTTVEVLNPQWGKSFPDENDNSVVLLLTYHNSTLLLTGDSEMASEDYYRDKLPHIDVLKVGHHGSDSSTSAKLLAKVTPDYCIISVGKDNRYGHPGQTTLDWMGYYGCEIHRTDMEGDITMTTDGETWTVL